MDVISGKAVYIAPQSTYTPSASTTTAQAQVANQTDGTAGVAAITPAAAVAASTTATTAQANQSQQSDKPVKKADLEGAVKEFNKLLDAMNPNMRFKIHEKTNEVMVQFIDADTQNIIKEFPPKSFLDMVAAIRSYVGMLLDKKI